MEVTLTGKNNTELTLKVNRSNIEVYSELPQINFEYSDSFSMSQFLIEIALKVWKDFKPKEANSFSSDYCDFYDRKLDNNGYLEILQNKTLSFEAPYVEEKQKQYLLYRFNKRKMQSFCYDLAQLEKTSKIIDQSN